MPRRRTRGQVIVELAILIPLLVLLAFGVIEFGRAVLGQLIVFHAARDGARMAVDASVNDTRITATVNKAAAPLTPTSIQITRPTGEVRVRVTYDFDPMIPFIHEFWGGGPVTIAHTAVSRPG